MNFGNFREGMSGISGKMSQLQRRLSQGMMQDEDGPTAAPNIPQQQQQTSTMSSPNPAGVPLSSSNTTPFNTGNQQNQNSMYNSPAAAASMQHQQQQLPNSSSSTSSSQQQRPNMSLNLNSTLPSNNSMASGAVPPGNNPPPSMSGPAGSAYQGPPSMQQRQQQQQQQLQQQQQMQQQQMQRQQQEQLEMQQRGGNIPKTTSAPSSPTKNYTPANIARSIFRQVSQSTTNLVQQTVAGVTSGGPRDKAKILLVIDDQHTDWSKYFRGRRIQNDFEIRIEQAEFNEINMAAFSDRGTMVDMEVNRGGTKVVRSFRPDFVLIRQPIRDGSRDYRHLLLALMYGNVPSVNSLDSLYTFLDKPLIFSQLIQIQNRLGRDKFPLIQQSFYPNYREMLTSTTFPVVVKIGHAHAGMGKTRVESHYDFQDIASLVASCSAYCSVEPFVDSKCDLHLQKIGPSYKAFIRKSISGSWKANIGSSMLEQVKLQDNHKMWLEECSRLFGGLDMFAIEVVVSKDGQEFIIGLNDSSSMGLLGETQEDDRTMIADMVFRKMDADANRRRLSSQLNQIPGQVPNGYGPGTGVPRRGSRETGPTTDATPVTRERDQSVPNYAQRGMGERTGGPPGGPPFTRDVTGRDPPMRDPRDSNIRDVQHSREVGAGPPLPPPPMMGSQNSGSVSSRFRDGPQLPPEPSRTSTFTSGVPQSGSSGSGFGSQSFGQALGRQMSRPNMGGPEPGSGPGSGRSSLSQQGQPTLPPGQGGGQRMPGQPGDSEDTMGNLKKTFAGIFGDM